MLPFTLAIYPGEQRQLVVGIVSTANRPLSGRTPTFVSSDARVASVSEAGMVAAIAEGNARISAVVEGVAGVSTVHVLPIPVFTCADPGVHIAAIRVFTCGRSRRSRAREIRMNGLG